MSHGIPSEVTMREAVAKRANAAPQGGVFFALVYTDKNGVSGLCEFDGCVCYEAYSTLQAANRCRDAHHENHPEYADRYTVRQVPAGIACYNRDTDRVERSGGTDEAFGVVFDGGFYSVTLPAPMVPQPVQQQQASDMRLGTETGSLVNHIYSRAELPEPAVGMGATLLMWSDRHALTIVRVFKLGKFDAIETTRDKAIRTDSNGMSDCQTYTYETVPDAHRTTWRKDPKTGWTVVYLNRDTGRWVKCKGDRILIGRRDQHHDFSF